MDARVNPAHDVCGWAARLPFPRMSGREAPRKTHLAIPPRITENPRA